MPTVKYGVNANNNEFQRSGSHFYNISSFLHLPHWSSQSSSISAPGQSCLSSISDDCVCTHLLTRVSRFGTHHGVGKSPFSQIHVWTRHRTDLLFFNANVFPSKRTGPTLPGPRTPVSKKRTRKRSTAFVEFRCTERDGR